MIALALLALAICAVWAPPVRPLPLPPWLAVFLLASIAGVVAGYLRPAALIGLGVLLLLAFLATRARATRLQRIASGFLAALMALLMAMHRLPGFDNPMLWENLRLSPDAAPFTLYANFDKGAAGLILLACFCRRSAGAAGLVATMRKALPFMLATPACVLAAAAAVHYVRPDLKLSHYVAVFLPVNLFFTVIAEEAFFRGLIQDRLARLAAPPRVGQAIAVTVSALSFGAAHFAGGATYVALATLAGAGYALAYARTKRIESAIAVHFLLNAAHFIGFTYPSIQPPLPAIG